MKKESFVVITQTTFSKADHEEIMPLILASKEIFERQSGLINSSFLINHEISKTTSILEWENKLDHENCMASPDFNHVNHKWKALMNEGRIKFKMETFKVL